MKLWIRRFGGLLAVIGGGAFLVYAAASLQVMDLLPYLTWRTLLALLAASVLYSLTVPISAWAWRRLLHGMGTLRPLTELNVILLTTQIGKYVPGNIGHHVGRMGLSLSRGIPSYPLVASMIYETLLLLLAGVLVGLTATLVSSVGIAMLGSYREALLIGTAIATIGLLLVPTLGWAIPGLIRGLFPGAVPATFDLRMGFRPCLWAFFGYVGAYLSIGLGIGVLSTSLFPADPQPYALLAGAFAIAWVVGFVTPGAPAGIGVREGVLTLILGTSLDPGNASILILALRIATTIGDVVCLLAGLLLARLNPSASLDLRYDP